jgi:hypothetical protein
VETPSIVSDELPPPGTTTICVASQFVMLALLTVHPAKAGCPPARTNSAVAQIEKTRFRVEEAVKKHFRQK